ncbi:MAG: GNAT family N-acetyltransferase [Thermoplasmata archaeon]
MSDLPRRVRIRSLRKGDAVAASRFCRRTNSWMYEKYLRNCYPKEASEFDARMKSPRRLAEWAVDRDKFCFIALDGDEICGIVMGTVFGKSGLAKVNWIAVDPDHQHEGIGIRLMTKAEEHLRKRGCHKIFLNTLPDLVPAIRLYMKFGLLPETYLRKHWWGVDFLVMSKIIGEYRKR